MLQITHQHRLVIALEPVDFRKGIDGLVAMSRQQLAQEPFDGGVFVFRNRRGSAVKLLTYDGNGFWLCQKRFSSGRLKWWPKDAHEALNLKAVQLLVILQQGLLLQLPEDFRRLPVP